MWETQNKIKMDNNKWEKYRLKIADVHCKGEKNTNHKDLKEFDVSGAKWKNCYCFFL